MDFKQLTRPFDNNKIFQRVGKKVNGEYLYFDYVPSEYVVDRLNEIGTQNWNFFLKESKEIRNEIVVLGSLTIQGITKEAYGSAVIYEERGVGNSIKTASSLALTKAASLFGIPCVFHTNARNKNNNQPQNQNSNVSQNSSCDDCATPIQQNVVQYCNNNSRIFQNKKLCMTCQKNYKNGIRRVQ
ncbi:hypothetical protein KK120_18550 [Virgibacillus dakarensis]|nr:hypothetical protein [Virgibacillus dakarensis]